MAGSLNGRNGSVNGSVNGEEGSPFVNNARSPFAYGNDGGPLGYAFIDDEHKKKEEVDYQTYYPFDYVFDFLKLATDRNILVTLCANRTALEESYERAISVQEISPDDRDMLRRKVQAFIMLLKRFEAAETPKKRWPIRMEMLEYIQRLFGSFRPDSEIIRRIEVRGRPDFSLIIYDMLPPYFLATYSEDEVGMTAKEQLKLRGGGGATRKKGTTVRTSSGDTFSVENSRKKWTRSNKYKKWLGKLTRKVKPNKKEEDLCVGKGSICKGDLGIPRKLMPQFNSPAEIKSFAKFVKKAYNIKSCKGTRKASQLKPSQGEINRKRIKGLIDEGVLDKMNVPLVVSGDNFVVDGHHRWAAYRLKKPDLKMPVVVIDAPVKDILGIAVAWGAKHQEF